MTLRPVLAHDDDTEAVERFVSALQVATDAVAFNAAFAQDVLWGSPFGAVVEGYDDLHAIHAQMLTAPPPGVGDHEGSTYVTEHARRVTDDVALAFVRRLSSGGEPGEPMVGRPDAFDELALFVLVRHDEAWWLAAALHTPDRREVYAQ